MKVNNAQLLQKVATAIAIKGPFLINLKNGIVGGIELAGALALINCNSSWERFLLSSGYEVTILFQK